MSQTTWVVDQMHSEVQFKVKHLVISTVTGSFTSFSGQTIAEGDQFENAQVTFSIDVNSVFTGQKDRDDHLKNSDFFESESFPQITFVSTSFTKVKGDLYKLTGNLTMKGVTREAEFEAEYGGTEKDMYGNTKVGFEVTGTVNRKEFGMAFNAVTETGGLALGENIKVIANVQLAKQAA
jgi:polyisoprenoid-binding protein YceI